jgi:ankyrin repeat protein
MRNTFSAALLALWVICAGCSEEPFEEPHLTLHALCQSGDATPERIQAFLDLGVDVNALREVGLSALGRSERRVWRADVSALQLAAIFCDAEAVECLIKAGADVNAKGMDDCTSLHFAAVETKNPDILRLLLQAGADVNARVRSSGWTPLHAAVSRTKNPDILRLLLQAGADVNAKDTGGQTPLDLALGDLEDTDEALEKLRILGAAGGKTGDELDAHAASP